MAKVQTASSKNSAWYLFCSNMGYKIEKKNDMKSMKYCFKILFLQSFIKNYYLQ